jgi:hypothetical protein
MKRLVGLAVMLAVGSAEAQTAPTVTLTAPGTAVFTWTAPASNGAVISGYNLYQAPTSAALAAMSYVNGSTPTASTAAGTLTYTLTGLAAGTYYYAVTAYACPSTPCQESPQSASVSVLVVPAAPLAPSGWKVAP